MRRGLAFLSIFLVLAGLELSTQGISLILSRFRVGFASVLGGAEFHVPGVRFSIGILALVFGAALWLLLAWSDYEAKEVAVVGATCPQCGNRTRRVKRREWQRLLSAILGERLTRRRCETCGWTGLSLHS